MGYRVLIHVELFPNVDFEYVFLDLTKNSKCLEHLRNLRARQTAILARKSCRSSKRFHWLILFSSILKNNFDSH